MRSKGKLKSWNDDKGFGFIKANDGGKDVFIHIKAFGNRNRRPDIGEMVSYAMSTDKQGRPCAASATLPGDRLAQEPRRRHWLVRILFAVLFLCLVGVSVALARMPLWIIAVYLTASLLAFVMYAFDKAAARSGSWRVQESSLQLISLLGGWPGAILAQETLRHKSKKQSFRLVFWVTVFLNIGGYLWLMTSGGAAMLKSISFG